MLQETPVGSLHPFQMSSHQRLSRLLAPPVLRDLQALARAVNGKTVLVTGASFGIGRELAKLLSCAGARVLVCARSLDSLTELAEEIRVLGGNAVPYMVDLRSPESVDELSGRILAEHPPDIVVHNAGKSIRRSLHHSLDRPHDFERCMGVNYLGPVRLQLAMLPSMIKRTGGQIVNVSSVNVRTPPVAYWAAYLCSKTAFDHWIAAATPELRPYRIACTSVYLGLVHTRMSAPTEAYASMPGQTAEQAARSVALGIVRRSRVVQPWWLGPAHWLSAPAQPLLEWAQARILPKP